MTDEEKKKVKVTVRDRRHTAAESESTSLGVQTNPQRPSEGNDSASARPEHDYLADLQRLQAEFENYRKRMMKEQAEISVRSKARLVESLLPVLDNFERAIAHGEGGEGVALVYRELKSALESEGLEEITAEGQTFDPTVHEAVMSKEDSGVTEETVAEVHRRGYRFGGQLLRPATVVVTRPPHEPVSAEEAAAAEEAAEA